MKPPLLTLPGPVWLISDLHLSPAMPRTLAAFETFLELATESARSLIILGDFFEFWVGDDERDDPFNQHVIACLHAAAQRGLALYLMHGNRDFLLGDAFARDARLTLLQDPTDIECEGQRVRISHGDSLCTNDVSYMRFRHWTRKRWVQRFFLALPLSTRLKIAQRLRADSEAGRDSTPRMQGDVTTEGVNRMLMPGESSVLIHGHTHRPHRHEEAHGERWVLSDWDFDHATARADALSLSREGVKRIALSDLLDNRSGHETL
jgi:UDP-2,3-diacylglucosamine hydrolase